MAKASNRTLILTAVAIAAGLAITLALVLNKGDDDDRRADRNLRGLTGRDDFTMAKVDMAGVMVKKLALEAYPQWAINPGNGAPGKCPTLAELGEYVSDPDLRDPWGNEYRFRCDDLPAGVTGIAVWSMGPDRVDGGGDDVTSW